MTKFKGLKCIALPVKLAKYSMKISGGEQS